MIAQRFGTIGSAAGVAGAALVFYLVSQWVAAERAGLDKVDRQIAVTQHEIRLLSMEIGSRGRLSQLEHWNAELWRLSAPKPRQFLASPVELASFVAPVRPQMEKAVAAAEGPTHVVAYQRPPAILPQPPQAAPPLEQPMLRQANYVRPAPAQIGVAAPAVVRKASLLPDDIGRIAATEATGGGAKARQDGQ